MLCVLMYCTLIDHLALLAAEGEGRCHTDICGLAVTPRTVPRSNLLAIHFRSTIYRISLSQGREVCLWKIFWDWIVFDKFSPHIMP